MGYMRVKVDIPFTEEERLKFKNYLFHEGKKAGQWIRRLILDEIARREAIERGGTQIDFDAIRRRSAPVEAKEGV